MTEQQIKKALYKEKPIAKFIKHISHPILRSVESAQYEAETSLGKVTFIIPVKDWPIELKHEEPAQLLIRWLVVSQTAPKE